MSYSVSTRMARSGVQLARIDEVVQRLDQAVAQLRLPVQLRRRHGWIKPPCSAAAQAVVAAKQPVGAAADGPRSSVCTAAPPRLRCSVSGRA